MSEENNNHAERIGKLETAVNGIWAVLDKLQKGQDEIQHAISDSGKTNWSVLIAALGVLLSFGVVMWGAAIHPLNQDIERQSKNEDRIADAVIVQNDKWSISQEAQNAKIQDLQTAVIKLVDWQDDVRVQLKRFDEQGSAVADKRLLLLEYQINHASHPIQTKTGTTP